MQYANEQTELRSTVQALSSNAQSLEVLDHTTQIYVKETLYFFDLLLLFHYFHLVFNAFCRICHHLCACKQPFFEQRAALFGRIIRTGL